MLTGQATLGNGLESKLSLDIKLLKYKESFAYKLRKLRDLLFQENVNGSMSSSSTERYVKIVQKFVTKFKN